MPPTAEALARARARWKLKKNRASKKASIARSRIAALPKVPQIILDVNYVNPVTLEFPKGTIVYELKNRFTGRTNYYNKSTFTKLIKAFTNDYNLLMMNPKKPIEGASNPVTRNPIYPRNVRRVTVRPKPKTPNRNTAARKIQSAVRKHLSKKRATVKPKTPSTKRNTKSKSRSK